MALSHDSRVKNSVDILNELVSSSLVILTGSEWISQDRVTGTSEQSSNLRTAITVCSQELDCRKGCYIY